MMKCLPEDFHWYPLDEFMGYPIVTEIGWDSIEALKALTRLGIIESQTDDLGVIRTCLFNIKKAVYFIRLNGILSAALRNKDTDNYEFDEILLAYLVGEGIFSSMKIVT